MSTWFRNRPLALQFACLCLPVLAVACVMNYVTGFEVKRTFFEGTGILTILLIFVTRKPVYMFLKTLPHPHRCFAMVFFLVLFLSHLVYKPRTTFPFVSWDMYATSMTSNEATFYQYRGLGASREAITINPSRLFPPLKGSLILELERRFKSLQKAGDETQDSVEQKKQLREILSSIGHRYNRVQPDNPISALEVHHCTLSLKAVSPSEAVCRPLLRVELQGGKTE